MPGRLVIILSVEQRQELEHARDHHAKPYIRERAAAVLKVADGMSGNAVAQSGLLKRRDSDTLYSWLHRYLAEGLPGLLIRKGRGRKAAFSPSVYGCRNGPGGLVAHLAPTAYALRP